MSAIIGVAGTAGIVAGGVLAAKLSEKIAEGLYNTTIHSTIKSIKSAWDSHAPSSYIRTAAPAKVEPFVMVDESVVYLPYTRDVMGALQRVFSCNYLLAQAVQNQIGGLTIAKRIDRFSPDRSLDVASQHFLSMESVDNRPIGVGPLAPESYSLSLPTPGVPVGIDRFGTLAEYVKGPIRPTTVYACEETEKDEAVANLLSEIESNESSKGNSGGLDQKSIDAVTKETANLAIGQILNLKIVHEDKEATIPVQIRMRPISVSSSVVSGTFALRGNNYTIGSRLRAFRVGEIDWKDLVFQTDAIREYRKLVKSDKSGFFRKSYDRANKNLIAHLLSGKSSIGSMSSIILTSTATVRDFEYKTGQRLSDFNTRQAIMEDSLTMIIGVIDTDHETLTIYLDSVDDENTYLIQDLKVKGKNDSDDMSSLLNSLLEGRIPGRL